MQVPGGSIYLMSTYFSSSKVLVVVGLVGTSISIVDFHVARSIFPAGPLTAGPRAWSVGFI